MAAGPLVGGVLVQTAGWRSIFWLNPPIGLAALVCAARLVPESRAAAPRRMDPIGQLLVIVLMGTLTYAVIQAPATGWRAPGTLGCAVAACAALVALLPYERRRAEPLVDLRVFRSAGFSGASGMAACSFFVLGGFLFLNTLYLQNVRGLSALAAGAYLLPMAGMNILTSPISGRLTATCGPRLPLLLAGAATTVGGLLLADAEIRDTLLFPAYCLIGIGMGLANTPITNAAMAGMPEEQAGVAAAVVATSRQFGQALGVAVLGGILAAGLHHGSYAGFVAAERPAYWLVTACGAAILVLTLLTTARPTANPVDRTQAPPLRRTAPTGGTEAGS